MSYVHPLGKGTLFQGDNDSLFGTVNVKEGMVLKLSGNADNLFGAVVGTGNRYPLKRIEGTEKVSKRSLHIDGTTYFFSFVKLPGKNGKKDFMAVNYTGEKSFSKINTYDKSTVKTEKTSYGTSVSTFPIFNKAVSNG